MTDQPVFSPSPRRPFSIEEKVALVLLIVSGVGGLFFGFRYLGKNLQSPFAFSYSGPEYLSADEEESKRIEQYKARDTDGDTLNDYDELYVYKTSPYLVDSDSDGYNDDTELASGNDPNCPIGKSCTGVASADTSVDSSDAILEGLTEPTSPDLQAAQQALDDSGGDVDGLINNMTPEELRLLLIQSGADEAQVNALLDDELMQLYTEALTQYQGSSETTTP